MIENKDPGRSAKRDGAGSSVGPNQNSLWVAKGKSRTFTGEKLDWMSAVSADHRLTPRDFQVAFCIAQHVNQRKRTAVLSDDTITDKTGIARGPVLRARESLKKAGWIDWKRTRTANIYTMRDDPMREVIERQSVLKEARDRRRSSALVPGRGMPPVKHLEMSDVSPVKHQDAPPVAQQDVPPVEHIHLSENTLELTQGRAAPPPSPLEETPDFMKEDDARSFSDPKDDDPMPF